MSNHHPTNSIKTLLFYKIWSNFKSHRFQQYPPLRWHLFCIINYSNSSTHCIIFFVTWIYYLIVILSDFVIILSRLISCINNVYYLLLCVWIMDIERYMTFFGHIVWLPPITCCTWYMYGLRSSGQLVRSLVWHRSLLSSRLLERA